jgi:hypothetical protein
MVAVVCYGSMETQRRSPTAQRSAARASRAVASAARHGARAAGSVMRRRCLQAVARDRGCSSACDARRWSVVSCRLLAPVVLDQPASSRAIASSRSREGAAESRLEAAGADQPVHGKNIGEQLCQAARLARIQPERPPTHERAEPGSPWFWSVLTIDFVKSQGLKCH